MPTGSIKFFNAAKGYGFITSDDGGKDIFVPPASAVSLGVPLKAGQRVSFETAPDGKGPKATNLVVLANPVPPKMAQPAPRPISPGKPADRLTYYHDPASGMSGEVLAILRDAGYEPKIVDYIVTPPDRDELKRLSLLMSGGSQGLVRRFDRLFQELQLDDRFISENEFWTAIVEHPTLINGPLVATAGKAGICHSAEAAKRFLAALSPNADQSGKKRENLPRPVASPISVDAPIPPVEPDKEKKRAEAKLPSEALDTSKVTAKSAARAKPKTKAKVQSKAVTKAAPKPARATAPKAKAISPKKKVAKKAKAAAAKKPRRPAAK